LSNLLKSISIITKNNEAKIIDNNSFIYERLTRLNDMTLCCTMEEDYDGSMEGTQCIESVESMEARVKEESERIVENAKMEANSILMQAAAEADKLKKEAMAIGRKEAFDTVVKEATSEIETMKQELNAKSLKLDEEYNKRLSEMESTLVDAMLKVFNNITCVLAEDKKDLILNLVNSVMTKAEIGRNFIIKVSKEDYPFLSNNRESIRGAVLKDADIEIIEDSSLKKTQCVIETDGGVYDCSLDVQLENLTKDIKILSCMQN
jgi:flagellar assembly protein FliH